MIVITNSVFSRPRKGGLNNACLTDLKIVVYRSVACLRVSQLVHRGQRASCKCGRNSSKVKRRIPLALKGVNITQISTLECMWDSCNNTRPEQRSALIAHELVGLDIGHRRGVNDILYWSVKSTEDRRSSSSCFQHSATFF